MVKKVGRPTHNHKIKKLEQAVEELRAEIIQTDLDVHTVDTCRQDAESDMLRMIRRLETNSNVVYGKNTKSRKRRRYHPLSILYSRKTRRGVRAIAIYGTVIFAGAYALSLLLQ